MTANLSIHRAKSAQIRYSEAALSKCASLELTPGQPDEAGSYVAIFLPDDIEEARVFLAGLSESASTALAEFNTRHPSASTK